MFNNNERPAKPEQPSSIPTKPMKPLTDSKNPKEYPEGRRPIPLRS